mgnify:CR=1 FL=1
MRIYKINNITGAIRQIFGKKQALGGKALEADSAFAQRMGVSKVAAAIKAAPVAQKVGMAVATVAVAGGTAAGIVAINQPAPAPTQPSTPAITQPKAEETKPEEKVEETKSEEKTDDTKPAEETKPEESKSNVEAPAQSALAPTAQAAPQEPAVEQPKAPAEPVKLGEQHVFYGTSAVDNVEYTSSYGYNGEFSSYDEALAAVKDRLARAGKATPGGLFEKTIVFYSDGTSEVIESHRVI